LPKKILVAITASLVVLVAAASAYAAINTYTAKITGLTKGGTAAHPKATGFTENLTAKGTNGNRAGLLSNITTTIYGVKANLKGLPTCSLNSIAAAKSDTGCPKGAALATGYIHAIVGSPTNFKTSDPSATPCNPGLDVWNEGGGKAVYFFVDTAAHNCDKLGLKTGSTGPWQGTIKMSGKNMVMDTPIPAFVSRPLGTLAGSLSLEHLIWAKSLKNSKGKSQVVFESVGCKGKSRPYSTSFTAAIPTGTSTNGPSSKSLVKGKAAC
jgi:hypothetical protein